jgi:hypothetical protein
VQRRHTESHPSTHTLDPACVLVCSHVLVPGCACAAQVRAQEEVAAVRRRAAWVAREVGGFWAKADRVVNYKVGVCVGFWYGV